MTNFRPPRGEQVAGEKAGIRLLSDAVIDQIAAGEVIERPASIVKELVENAIDADAMRIVIEARDGGAALVAVTDDGCGMAAADCLLAIQRHATSKLTCAADLEQVMSFGFRGEALPSIASVSRMRLRTRLRGSPPDRPAHELQIEAGRVLSECAVGGADGTRVEVADLFFNVPARRKFLKRPTTEWSHITQTVSQIALALPEVHFELRNGDRRPVAWPGTRNRLDRIAAVLSEDEAAALIAGEYEEGGLRAELYVSVPERTRATAAGLYLFVNGRAVRDRLLRHALLDACRDWLPRGRFPTALLFLSVPPGSVDVNVHPAKWEIRFEDPSSAHRVVRRAVRAALESRSWLGGRPASAPGAANRSPGGEGSSATTASALPGWGRGFGNASRVAEGSAPRDAVDADGGTGTAGSGAAAPRVWFQDMRCAGQLLASYLLVESEDGLLLVDQHAAHERVLYERLRTGWLETRIEQQVLLWPVTIEIDPVLAAELSERTGLLARLGFEVALFGEGSVMVRAVPALLADRDPTELVRELARAVAEAEVPPDLGADSIRWLPALDRVFATLACHSARRFGDQLPAEEQRALLTALDAIPWAPTCPHGRPIATLFDRAEIERRFGRR